MWYLASKSPIEGNERFAGSERNRQIRQLVRDSFVRIQPLPITNAGMGR